MRLHELPRAPLEDRGLIRAGMAADLIVFDPDMPYVLDKRDLKSLSKNSPFDEARLQGQVTMTMVAGRVVFQRDTM